MSLQKPVKYNSLKYIIVLQTKEKNFIKIRIKVLQSYLFREVSIQMVEHQRTRCRFPYLDNAFFLTILNKTRLRIISNWLLVRSSKILILNKFEIGYLVNRALVVKSLARQIGIKNIHAHPMYKRAKCAHNLIGISIDLCTHLS